jgi:hypothetical protein
VVVAVVVGGSVFATTVGAVVGGVEVAVVGMLGGAGGVAVVATSASGSPSSQAAAVSVKPSAPTAMIARRIVLTVVAPLPEVARRRAA